MAVRRSKHDRIKAKKERLARQAAARGEARKAGAAG
jgi:hypothetical protein